MTQLTISEARRSLLDLPEKLARVPERAGQLAKSPEQQGKPLIGELNGFRSVRAAGQRYRIVYLVERREVVVAIVAVGKRKEGDKRDVYVLARKLLRLGLLR